MTTLGKPQAAVDTLDHTSRQYLGQWNRLISTTNWEKGRIIAAWRAELQAAGVDAAEFSDEAWSRQVGNVTGQHVGRLRRVFERFGPSYATYAALYWSHFQAALDWNDAEMWLEGAVQNEWSITAMRSRRYETLKPANEAPPRDDDIVTAELDEDRGEDSDAVQTLSGELEQIAPVDGAAAGKTRGSSHDVDHASAADRDARREDSQDDDSPPVEPVRPFARLAELPADLADAFEAYKLALLHHKIDGWRQISCDEALATLDALKELALARSDG